MRRIMVMAAATAMLLLPIAQPAMAQRHGHARGANDDEPVPYSRDGYDDREQDGRADRSRGYDDGYPDGRDTASAVQEAQCKRRKGKGALVGALGGGLVGNLSSKRHKFRNTAIAALGGGILGDLVGKRGTEYDC